MRKKLLALQLAALLITGLSLYVDKARASATIAISQGISANLPILIPFETVGSTIFVPIRVNGSRPRWFILDTGANDCGLADELAKTLHLNARASAEGSGAGKGPVPYRRYARKSALFDINGIQFRCEHLFSLDLSQQPAILGRTVDGFLGSDFISQYVVVIDYDSEVLQLYDRTRFEYRGMGDVLPLTFDKRLPYVTARLTVAGVPPVQRRLLIDTGSEDAVDDNLILKSTGPHREVTGGVGLGQPYKVISGWVEQLELGRFQLSHLPSVAPGISLIGGEVLRRFRIILDYSRHHIILEPGAHFADAYRGDRSGLELWSVPAEGTLIVHEVRSGSAGAAAGLSVGDRILAIDGATVQSLGFERMQTMLTIPGADYRVRVKRASTIRDVELHLDSAE